MVAEVLTKTPLLVDLVGVVGEEQLILVVAETPHLQTHPKVTTAGLVFRMRVEVEEVLVP